MKIPITQSGEWQKLQSDLGEVSFLKQCKNFQYLAILSKTPIGNYLYCPYGPVSDNETGFKLALKSLEKLAQAHQAFFIRIEPQNPDFKHILPGNAKKTKDQNPKDTWVLDLDVDKAEIIKNFSQGTRTRYNNYAKKGLSVTCSTDVDKITFLTNLQNKLYKQKKLHAFSEEYLKNELAQPFAQLYMVEYHRPDNKKPTQDAPKEGQVIAASLFFDFQDTRYYMQSAADTDYRKLPATVALLTSAIFDAKEQGIKHFDFWGAAPQDAAKDHPWAGFTEFKKSFGGYFVHYAGTYDIIMSYKKYAFYQVLRKINHLIRKI